jgi:6-phosphogluconolactonase (cycloisomerase 2 family)
MKRRSLRPALCLFVLLLLSSGCVIESDQPSTVAAPAFSPLPGTYVSALDVTITTSTPGATIRYTTDGSTPTETSGAAYGAPVRVADSLILTAVAFRAGWTTSPASTGQYTISTVVQAPVFSPGPGAYTGARDVVIVTSTPGASIRYTTDGSTPTEAHGTPYTGPVPVAETLTLKAVAYLAGLTTSPVTSGLYTITPRVAAPAFSPAPGTYENPQDVAITTSTPGATIRYTTDGSTPTETHGTVYAAPVHVTASLTLKAIATLAGWAASPVTAAEYRIGLFVAEPVFSPAPGTYESAQDVAIATSTPGATIRYTTDGSTPTETHGIVYAAPVPIADLLTLKAVAYRTGWTTSSVITGQYTIEPIEPTYKQYAYVANAESHTVSAFAIDPDAGTLTAIEGSPFAAGGVYPWSVAVHPSHEFLYVLNYASRDISIFSIEASTGALTAISGSPCQTGGIHPAWIAAEPAGKFLYMADAAMDGIRAFVIDPVTGALTASGGPLFPTGISPVSIAIVPSGKFAYTADSGSHTISAFTINAATGALTSVPGSPFSAGGLSPATVAVDSSGTYVYVTNGASDSLSAFAIDPASGALAAVPGSPFAAGGTAPVFVAVAPTGKFVYAANTNSTVSGFAVDDLTGALTAVPGSPFAAGGIYPKAIAFDHAGRFAYVANAYSASVSAFAINAATGSLTALSGSPFITGNRPYFVVTVRIAR